MINQPLKQAFQFPAKGLHIGVLFNVLNFKAVEISSPYMAISQQMNCPWKATAIPWTDHGRDLPGQVNNAGAVFLIERSGWHWSPLLMLFCQVG
jgi:hypothetical protein